MKLLRITAEELLLFKEKLDLTFYAQQRITEEQKGILYPLFSNIYLNSATGFIGINASGKTSALKVILLALEIINNEPINHIETRDILGDAKEVKLNMCFFPERRMKIFFHSQKIFLQRSLHSWIRQLRGCILMKKTTTINGEMKEITIQCDLIVHSRGTNKQRDNLIAVEMKKSYQTQECKEIKGCGSLKEGG